MVHWLDLTDGSIGKAITELPMFTQWDISPDGNVIVACEPQKNQIFLIDLQNNQQKHFTLPMERPQAFHWASDGKRFYVTGMHAQKSKDPEDSFTYALLEVDLNGEHRFLRAQNDSWMAFPRASYDDQHIAFSGCQF